MKTSQYSGEDFRRAIGAFVIAFSEVEFGLSMIAAMALADRPQNRDKQIRNAMSKTLSEKRKVIKKYISDELPQLGEVWKEVNDKIGELNNYRRYLTHGHTQFFEPTGYISPVVVVNKKLFRKRITLEEIEEWTDQLHHLISGDYGVQGEFEIMFSTARINLWNSRVAEGERMEFRMNGKVLTEWSRTKE